MTADPHTFIPLTPKDVIPTGLVLDPARPRTVYEDPTSGERYAQIPAKNHLGQNNYPLGQAIISLCCKGVLKVSEAVPIHTPDGNTIIASRIINLEETRPAEEDFSKNVNAERWILRYIFGDPDHSASTGSNLHTTPDGRYAWFDYAQGADNFFFLGSEINENNVLRAQEDGIAPFVLQKLQQLEENISDPSFVASIFERIEKNFPDKKMSDMFYDAADKTPLDFQQVLQSRVRSAIQQFQALPESL